MKCSKFHDLLDDYCRGHLDEDQGREMDMHVISCQSCVGDYQEYQEFLSLLAKEPEMAIDPAELAGFVPDVWQKIENERKGIIRNWAFKLAPSLAAAALLAFLVFRPAIDTTTQTSLPAGSADISSYTLIEQEPEYTDSTYINLLGLVFGDENTETLQLYEDELSSYPGVFTGVSHDLDDLSVENLKLIDKKLAEHYNKAG